MLKVRGVRQIVLSALAASVFVAMSGVGVAHAVTAPPWGDAVPATFATDVQNTSPDAYFNSVSCVSAGNCTAAGYFKDLAGNRQAFTQTSTGGTWAVAVPATFGTDVQNTSPDAYFNSVSCVSAGNCTAAGRFYDLAGNLQAFTQTSTGGTWAVAVPATFGTDVQNTNPNAQFYSVSCVSAGNCTAAGAFKDLAGNYQAFTQTSTNGTWAVAVPATFGTDVQNTNPNTAFNSVSCVSAGNCTAAGYFKDLAGNLQAFTQTSTGGTWAVAVPATFGTDVQNTSPDAYFYSVSCVSAGNCTAAGAFKDLAGNSQAFTQTSTNGTWAVAVPATFGTDVQNTSPNAYFSSVSCASAGKCTAAGAFKDLAGNRQAFTQTSTGGTWAVAVPATFGTDVQNTNPLAGFNSVSCVSAGNCTAAGRFTDLAGKRQAFTQTSTNGTWAVAVPATFGTDVQNTNPNAYFFSVSCVSAGNCTAAGRFKDLAGSYQAFTQSMIQPTLPPTGANTNRFIAVAVALLAAGAVLVATRRRRTISA